MQRGFVGFPFPTGKQIVNPGAVSPGLTTANGSGAMKASILVFDTTPGTRSWVVPIGVYKIRAAVVGAGGGGGTGTGGSGGYSEKVISVVPGQTFSYTVGAGGSGASAGGTSSFGGLISATGGAGGIVGAAAGGVGSGGDVNTTGGVGVATGGAGSSGHRFGNGQPATTANGGSGWGTVGISGVGGNAGIDGYGIGLIPGQGGSSQTPGAYGAGGGQSAPGGLGGGAGTTGSATTAGTGAVSGTATVGGAGGIIVEVIG